MITGRLPGSEAGQSARDVQLAGPLRAIGRVNGGLGDRAAANRDNYEFGQLTVTLSAVILAITHCGFGPANPG